MHVYIFKLNYWVIIGLSVSKLIISNSGKRQSGNKSKAHNNKSHIQCLIEGL